MDDTKNMEQTPYMTIKMARNRGLSVNLETIKNTGLVHFLPAQLVWDTDNGTWYVEDVFGEKIYSYEIIRAHLCFIGMVKD